MSDLRPVCDQERTLNYECPAQDLRAKRDSKLTYLTGIAAGACV